MYIYIFPLFYISSTIIIRTAGYFFNLKFTPIWFGLSWCFRIEFPLSKTIRKNGWVWTFMNTDFLNRTRLSVVLLDGNSVSTDCSVRLICSLFDTKTRTLYNMSDCITATTLLIFIWRFSIRLPVLSCAIHFYNYIGKIIWYI